MVWVAMLWAMFLVGVWLGWRLKWAAGPRRTVVGRKGDTDDLWVMRERRLRELRRPRGW